MADFTQRMKELAAASPRSTRPRSSTLPAKKKETSKNDLNEEELEVEFYASDMH